MDPSVAIGLWRSSFGPVKIERDTRQPGPEFVQGAWRYMRGQQEVIGVFWGRLNGNVLNFNWQEPAQPQPLQGSGYLVFDIGGARFDGKWWTANNDRSGDWNGWRAHTGGEGGQPPAPAGGYGDGGGDWGGAGGQTYGGGTYGGYETAPGPPPAPPADYTPPPRDVY